MSKPLVIRTKFCEVCNKALRSDAILMLCREHGKKLRAKNYHTKNKASMNAASLKYRKDNLEKIQAYDRQRSKTTKRKKACREREKIHMTYDKQFRLAKYLRTTIYAALKNNSGEGKATEFLGCSIAEYKKYITGLFTKGMSWDNHGDWHIDHINPIFKHDLTDKEQFMKAAHYTNTQPLWAADNIAKRDLEVARG